MKALPTEALALLGNRIALALLIELQLAEPVYLTTAGIDLDHDGVTWIGGRGVAIDKVRDQGGEVQAMRFTLSGVPSEQLALALGTQIQGRVIRVHTALMDPDTQAIVHVQQLWAGTLDQMPVTHGTESSVVGVTAEHVAIAMARPKGARYTDADQRRLHPGDRCLEYLVAQATHQDVWPAAAFFRQ